jgi:hypothetical protein
LSGRNFGTELKPQYWMIALTGLNLLLENSSDFVSTETPSPRATKI